ncbi:dehydrogenase/reductase SDR family protein 7-like [Trichogramma pretiosum]|uniref:dehydrogenase/reductase SDR family protein 7-like n=1 Tax=Trichogramma pretiosum TaxID=7493 RepID=UPI0006C95DB6|nr:dehydrogenase/reductase SDR family protein 7-like [Trichogramma pretiosum]
MFFSRSKNSNLHNKVVVITGASSGLGEALAHAFYKCGCKLILVSRRLTELQRVKQALLDKHDNTITTFVPAIFTLDLTEINSLPAEAAKIVQIYGRIDILINNAGVSYRGEVVDTQIDVDIKVMLINYFAQVAFTKAFLPTMLQQQSGEIVCISSVQGKMGIPMRSAYAASKHALQAWCDSTRAELHSKNINVCVICPGYIQTSLSLNALTGNGETYGLMDATTAAGYSPEYVAEKVVKAVQRGEKEIVIAPIMHRIAILLRTLFPSVFFWLMKKRAESQKKLL